MDDSERALPVSRRSVLGAVGTAIVGGAAASAGTADQNDGGFVVRQGDRCVPVAPLSGDEPVEEFYDYRLPERFVSAENGASALASGAAYSSNGTADLQRHDASIAFLYDGPEGLSLVVVHGKVGESPAGGGSATFELAGLPEDGEWVVKDDLYRDESGAPATTNYDRWRLDGDTDTVDWTWGSNGTDGGAFRGLTDDAAVTVRPAFNDRAALYEEHYEGTVEDWQFLTADGDGVRRLSLDMTAPVTVGSDACEDGSTGRGTDDGDDHDDPADVATVEFRGCGEAWVVLSGDEGPWPVPVTVETSAGDREVAITSGDLTTVPGQFGGQPLYKWSGEGKVLAVETGDDRYENDNPCARRGSGRDGSSDEDDVRDEGGEGDDDHDEEDDHEEGGDDEERDDDREGGNRGNGKGRGGRGDGRGRGNGRGRGPPDDEDKEDDEDD